MSIDAPLTQNPLAEATPHRPLWTTLTRWWSPTAGSANDAVLGYESALPWTLGDDVSAESGETRYY